MDKDGVSKLPSIYEVDFDEYGAYSMYNWELFFHAPLFIATRLSKNGKYAEAMKWFHYIFNPTTNLPDSVHLIAVAHREFENLQCLIIGGNAVIVCPQFLLTL